MEEVLIKIEYSWKINKEEWNEGKEHWIEHMQETAIYDGINAFFCLRNISVPNHTVKIERLN